MVSPLSKSTVNADFCLLVRKTSCRCRTIPGTPEQDRRHWRSGRRYSQGHREQDGSKRPVSPTSIVAVTSDWDGYNIGGPTPATTTSSRHTSSRRIGHFGSFKSEGSIMTNVPIGPGKRRQGGRGAGGKGERRLHSQRLMRERRRKQGLWNFPYSAPDDYLGRPRPLRRLHNDDTSPRSFQ